MSKISPTSNVSKFLQIFIYIDRDIIPANGLNDVTCDATSALNSPEIRTASDLHIFVDTTWQFNEIQPALAYVDVSKRKKLKKIIRQHKYVLFTFSTLLENLDVNRFGTRFTLYNANDASIIINTTSSFNDLFLFWNQTSHQTQSSGLNLAAIIKQIRLIGTDLLLSEHEKSLSGGRSYISLIVPQLSGVSEPDSNFAAEQLINLRETQPDLTLLFWAGD